MSSASCERSSVNADNGPDAELVQGRGGADAHHAALRRCLLRAQPRRERRQPLLAGRGYAAER